MTKLTERIRNGVDSQQLYGTLDLLRPQPELATFQFRATNEWLGGAHNRSSIAGSTPRAGRTPPAPSRSSVDAGEPPILLGANEGPTRWSTCCTRWPRA